MQQVWQQVRAQVQLHVGNVVQVSSCGAGPVLVGLFLCRRPLLLLFHRHYPTHPILGYRSGLLLDCLIYLLLWYLYSQLLYLNFYSSLLHPLSPRADNDRHAILWRGALLTPLVASSQAVAPLLMGRLPRPGSPEAPFSCTLLVHDLHKLTLTKPLSKDLNC